MSRRWLLATQAVLTVVAVGFAVRAIARHWDEFRRLHVALEVRPAWLAAAVLLVLATYLLQIESWREVLAGWRQRIPIGAAARTWCLSNLGRYIPGKVWSVTGMVVLAQRAGVGAAQAAGSAVAVQALMLGGGVAVVLATLPATESRGGGGAQILAAGLAAVATLLAFRWPPALRAAQRVFGPGAALEPLPWRALLVAAGLAIVSWLAYGLSFWLLGRGLVGEATPPVPVAIRTFALSYIIGWLALFAPGGVGVRELTLVGLLTPVTGTGPALALSIGSRILLTLTELGAAALTLAVPAPAEEERQHAD